MVLEVIKLFPSDKYDIASVVRETKLPLPLYTARSIAQQALFEQLASQEAEVYVVLKNKRPALFISFAGEQLINLLAADVPWLGWQVIFAGIEHASKLRFQQKIQLAFPQKLSMLDVMTLEKQGFACVDEHTAEKALHYHTALVLGGGGARGAYQIGVWQALKELDISFDLITGTSVGALNGALIVQDDFEQAKTMWEKIETRKILSFPMKETTTNTFSELLGQIASFTVTAIQSKGVSTEPLQRLLQDTFSEERLRNAQQAFYLVTTQLPGVTERVIHFNSCEDGQWQRWLLASSSFFPAMVATVIDGHFYVDGGYRNNIPVDVALEKGATEYIIVDVKGPGFSKQVTLPDEQPQIILKTPWPMGTVLLFDGARSALNIQLGYLETLKAFGKYTDYWYTFEDTLQELALFQEAFFRYVRQTYQLSFWKNREERSKIYHKLRKYYKDRVHEETISLALVELLGKQEAILPDKAYTFEEFTTLLNTCWQAEKQTQSFEGLSSVQEWLGRYYDEFFLLSEKRQFQLMTEFLQVESSEKSQRLSMLFERLPVLTLKILLKEFIQKETITIG